MNLRRRLNWLEDSARQKRRKPKAETLSARAAKAGIDLPKLQRSLGLPLPEGTPPDVYSVGVKLLKAAVQSEDFSSWDAWIADQYSRYGGSSE